MKIPEDEKILRMNFIEIGELPLVADFMKKYLLPTMYESGGIGIAAIQVGANKGIYCRYSKDKNYK